eukprot:m.95683 g.95683  ORF g.95683 m.95683 type:complete len:224 (-) comp8609_c0_seq2:21-692(-)
MHPADRYMLHLLAGLAGGVTKAYEQFAFFRAVQALQTFASVDLSAFYFEITKDRLYADAASSLARRSAQTAMHHIADAMARAVAPVACHLAEEIHAFRDGRDPAAVPGDSIVKSGWIAVQPEWHQPELAAQWDGLRDVRRAVFKVVHEARLAGLVGDAADSHVVIVAPPPLADFLGGVQNAILRELFLCAQVPHCNTDHHHLAFWVVIRLFSSNARRTGSSSL